MDFIYTLTTLQFQINKFVFNLMSLLLLLQSKFGRLEVTTGIRPDTVDDYYCKDCDDLLIVPYETECCAILICIKCYSKAQETQVCSCGENIKANLTKNAQKRVMKLSTWCLNAHKGCGHTSTIEEMIKHDAECTCELIQCNKCPAQIYKSNMQYHIDTECFIECKYKKITGCSFRGFPSSHKIHIEDTNHDEQILKYIQNLKDVHQKEIADYTAPIVGPSDETKKIAEQISMLEAENVKLKNSNNELKEENTKLHAEKQQMQDSIIEYDKKYTTLLHSQNDVVNIPVDVVKQMEYNKALEEENKKISAENTNWQICDKKLRKEQRKLHDEKQQMQDTINKYKHEYNTACKCIILLTTRCNKLYYNEYDRFDKYDRFDYYIKY